MTVNNYSTIDELLDQCRRGDDAAHASFYNRYQPFIQGVIVQHLRKMNVYHNQSDIEDLCNDVLLKFSSDSYKSFESIRSIKSIDGWLYVLVKNFVTSHVRKQIRSDRSQRHFVNEQATSCMNDPTFEFLHDDQKELVLQSLETLDTQERLVLTMYYLDHLKYYEIAEVLHMNINTVATKIKRAKEKLHKRLRKHKDDF